MFPFAGRRNCQSLRRRLTLQLGGQPFEKAEIFQEMQESHTHGGSGTRLLWQRPATTMSNLWACIDKKSPGAERELGRRGKINRPKLTLVVSTPDFRSSIQHPVPIRKRIVFRGSVDVSVPGGEPIGG